MRHLQSHLVPACVCLLSGAALCSVAVANDIYWVDKAGDAVIRRTDIGNDGLLSAGALPPDLLAVIVSPWLPTDPQIDIFTGSTAGTSVVRFDLVFKGLVNPPGPLGLGSDPFDPFLYGTNAVYGYIEVDVDADVNTGGELGGAATLRRLANLSRFSEVPLGPLFSRAAVSSNDYDSDFFTPPQFERSGTDFAVSLCGCWSPVIVFEDGNMDQIFDAGETWIVRGRFFERAHGYKDASGTFDASDFGLYDPMIDVQFSHRLATDTTTIRVIFPLNMTGAALLTGEPEQAKDVLTQNHVSVEEALDDIIIGAQLGLFGPTAVLTNAWATRQANQYLDPTTWRVSALVGMSYAQPEGPLYVWTDTGFNQIFADLNGDGIADRGADRDLFDAQLVAMDGGPDDEDGIVNGVVDLPVFSFGFHRNDLNYDGLINGADRLLFPNPADFNGDGVLDVLDFFDFIFAFNNMLPQADLNHDGNIDVQDFFIFVVAFSNP